LKALCGLAAFKASNSAQAFGQPRSLAFLELT
jgi:hypothetical protein